MIYGACLIKATADGGVSINGSVVFTAADGGEIMTSIVVCTAADGGSVTRGLVVLTAGYHGVGAMYDCPVSETRDETPVTRISMFGPYDEVV